MQGAKRVPAVPAVSDMLSSGRTGAGTPQRIIRPSQLSRRTFSDLCATALAAIMRRGFWAASASGQYGISLGSYGIEMSSLCADGRQEVAAHGNMHPKVQ